MQKYAAVAEGLHRAWLEDKSEVCDQSIAAHLDKADYPAGHCHQNAKNYALRHPGATIVQGWLWVYGHAWVRHSVIRTAEGRLVDVTLGPGNPWIFVSHQMIAHLCDVGFSSMPVQIQNIDETTGPLQ
tara:strand:+ start:3260 stop:3643 length:384 start_codon:yes stop_codon:yes gene_type:complete